MRDEDDIWCESLAGRTDGTPAPVADAPVPPGDAPAAKAAGEQSMSEGASLRAAIRAYGAHHSVEVDAVETIDPAREAALIERARARGIVPPATARAKAHRLASRRWPVWLAAAGLASIVVGVTVQLGGRAPERGAPAVVRGAPAVVRIHAHDPQGLQRELILELNDAGVHATGYDSFGRVGLDADLPNPLPDAVRKVLSRHGITPPPDSVLEVEIEPAESP